MHVYTSCDQQVFVRFSWQHSWRYSWHPLGQVIVAVSVSFRGAAFVTVSVAGSRGQPFAHSRLATAPTTGKHVTFTHRCHWASRPWIAAVATAAVHPWINANSIKGTQLWMWHVVQQSVSIPSQTKRTHRDNIRRSECFRSGAWAAQHIYIYIYI